MLLNRQVSVASSEIAEALRWMGKGQAHSC